MNAPVHYSYTTTTSHLEVTSTTTRSCLSRSRESKDQDGDVLIRTVQASFQSLSLSSGKPLELTKQKLFTVLLKRKTEQLDQLDNALEFKTALDEVLNGFLARVEDPSDISLIKSLLHDLKHQTLMEISTKYYKHTSVPSAKGTLLAILSSYLGNESKIHALAEKEAESLPSTLLSHFAFTAANRDSLMALLIEQRKQKHPNFNCYVIDICDLPACVESLKSLNEVQDPVKPQRIQLLVRNDVHYTAVDIEYTAEGFQAAVMDAAADERCKEILCGLKPLKCHSVYILGLEDRIQFDRTNCAFFSFDSVCQSAKDPHFFDLLKSLPSSQKEFAHSIAWKDMPARYVRNTTSTTFMTDYHSHHAKKKEEIYKGSDTFEAYVNKHVDQRDIKGTLRKVHIVLETKVLKQKPKVESTLDRISVRNLYGIVNQYLAQSLINRYQLKTAF